MDTLNLAGIYDITRQEISALNNAFFSGLFVTVIGFLAAAIAWNVTKREDGMGGEKGRRSLADALKSWWFASLCVVFLFVLSISLNLVISMIFRLAYQCWRIEEIWLAHARPGYEALLTEHQMFISISKPWPIFSWAWSSLYPKIADSSIYNTRFASQLLIVGVLVLLASLLIALTYYHRNPAGTKRQTPRRRWSLTITSVIFWFMVLLTFHWWLLTKILF